MNYLVPTQTICIENEIKRSRFITTIGKANSKKDALAFIENVRKKFPDANHHCYAYIVSDPQSASVSGMGDDGEPRGTAGKPMLAILSHSGMGCVVAVVTRYFGGIKLGKGGLVRAYSKAVQSAINELPVLEFESKEKMGILLPYALESQVRRLLHEMDGQVNHTEYQDRVVMNVAIPERHVNRFKNELQNRTQGEVAFGKME